MVKVNAIVWVITSMIFLTGKAQNTGNSLTVEFHGIKKEKGTKVYVALYNDKEGFLKKPFKGNISEINGDRASTVFTNLEPGTYAVSSFYDKNGNGKMDTNFLGIPKEPTAMSNNAKARFGPPKYEDAKFELKEDTTITINF